MHEEKAPGVAASEGRPDDTVADRPGSDADVRAGVAGYRAFQKRLADRVTPEEASDATRGSRIARRALGASVVAALAVQAAREAALRHGWPGAYVALDDLGWTLALLLPVLLGYVFRMPLGGRVHALIAAGFVVTAPVAPPIRGFDVWFWVELTALLGGAFALGAIVDWAAAPDVRRPQLARRVLVATGAAWIAFALVQYFRGVALPWLSLPASAAYLLAPWWPAAWAGRAVRLATPDAVTVFDASVRRFGHLVRGRAMAVLLGLLPMILFLANIGMEERLRLPEPRLAASDPASKSWTPGWFWARRGHVLNDEDLARDEIYALPISGEAAGLYGTVTDLVRQVTERPRDPAPFAALRAALGPHRVHDVHEMLALTGANGTGLMERFHLAEIPLRPLPGNADPGAVHVAEELRERVMHPMTPRWREINIAEAELSQWPLATFGVLGFILLWRRGGDSPTARWMGLYLIGCTSVATYAFSDLRIPAMEWQMWTGAASSPFGAFGLRVLGVLEALDLLVRALVWVGLPLWAVWAHLCWPVPYTSPEHERRRRLVVAAHIAAAAGIGAFVFSLAGLAGFAAGAVLHSVRVQMIALPVLGVVAVNAVMLGAGWFMRRRLGTVSEAPRLGWRPVAWFLSCEVLGLTILVALSFEEHGVPEGFLYLTKVLAGVFFALGVMTLLGRDFLRIAAGRDLSFAILAGFLPVAMQLGEDVAKEVLEHTPFVSEAGGRVLGIAFVAAALGPIEHLLEHIVVRLSVRRLHHIERAVDDAVETLSHATAPRQAAFTIAEAFAKLGVRGFLFYTRTAPCDFRLLLSEDAGGPPQELHLSPSVLGALGGGRRFIDLHSVAFEWPDFFHQFELYRLERATGMRYVLPVCLKSSVCGLLLLPSTDEAGEVSRDAVAQEMNDLGVAAVRARR